MQKIRRSDPLSGSLEEEGGNIFGRRSTMMERVWAATFREYRITFERSWSKAEPGFASRREMEIKMHRVVHDERGQAWIIGMKIERAEANGETVDW